MAFVVRVKITKRYVMLPVPIIHAFDTWLFAASWAMVSRLDEFPGFDSVAATRDMIGIGLNFAGTPNPDADIEATVVLASGLGMDAKDFRVLSVLTTWLGIHGERLHVSRLARLLASSSSRVRAYWGAVASWRRDQRGLVRLGALYSGPVVDLLTVGTEFLIVRNGEDPRFVGSPLRVPAKTLRDRTADVVEPAQLVCWHRGYRNRVLMGATHRADVWTEFERDPAMTAARAAERVGCALATARQVERDFQLLHPVPVAHAVNASTARASAVPQRA